MLIREAQAGDVPHILRHRRAMLREMGCGEDSALDRMHALCEPYLREAMAGGTIRAWLAESPSEGIAGGGLIEIIPWIPNADVHSARRAWIHNLYVEPVFRRRGIGRRLMETMVMWCKAQKFTFVSLHASAEGRPIYESLGFNSSNEMVLRFLSD